jgi:hypothetical protein
VLTGREPAAKRFVDQPIKGPLNPLVGCSALSAWLSLFVHPFAQYAGYRPASNCFKTIFVLDNPLLVLALSTNLPHRCTSIREENLQLRVEARITTREGCL